MKTTGIVRQMDSLGRIVLPQKDSLEIYVDGNQIILKKYEPTCAFCDNVKDVIQYKGRNICPRCLAELKKL